mgnify:CR=1 FL=1
MFKLIGMNEFAIIIYLQNRTSHYQLPISNYQLPITNPQSPNLVIPNSRQEYLSKVGKRINFLTFQI